MPNTGSMPKNKCTAQYVRETQIFWEFVHVDSEKEYKRMISKIKKLLVNFQMMERMPMYPQCSDPLPRGLVST